MPRMTAGQAVVECLQAEGIRHICGVVGSSFVEVLDALYGREDIRFVGARHEQGGAFMALGEAQARGGPAVCMGTNGPGATNLITGVAGAYVAHTPVIAITGAVMTEHVYRDVLQELDHLALFRPITKLALQVTQAQRIPEIMRHAFRVATTGKMGPVLVDIPRDLQNVQDMEVEILPPESYRPAQRPEGDRERLQAAAQVLQQAHFPVIVAGGGVKWSQAAEEVQRLAELLGAPIVSGYGRMDAIPNDHPFYIGPIARGAAPEAVEALQKADVVVAIGSRLAHSTTYLGYRFLSPEARIVQIEIDGKEIGRHFPVAVGIQGDARAVMAALLQLLDPAPPPPGKEERHRLATALRERRQHRLEEEAKLSSTPVKPQRVYAELRKVLPREAAVVFDGGASTGYGLDRLPFNTSRSFFSSLDLGCVGCGLPMALGVKLAQPQRPVVCISGDGGFLMNAQEMQTSVEHHIPVVNIVMNNNSWGAEKAYQKYLYEGRYVAADITNPRFDRYAELCGGLGFYVESPQDIGAAVEEALKAERPAVIEIPIDPEELPFPARAADVFRHKLGSP